MRGTTWAAALLGAAATSGCWIGETPTPELPEIEAGTSGTEVSETCECSEGAVVAGDTTGLKKRVYRFTQMFIEDPPELAGTLNSIWKADLAAQILNVIFEFKDTKPSQAGYPIRTATIQAVSGWRLPSDLLLEGQEVKSYCALDGTEADIQLEPATECSGQCRVRTSEFGALNFYAGSYEEPINCAPHLPVPHAIPITQVEARFNFDETCGRLVSGTLTACLERKAANNLCFCLRGGGTEGCAMNDSLTMEPLGEDATDADRAAYCRGCGPSGSRWIPLGNLIANVETPCDPPLGAAGVKISGVFTAEEITDRYTGLCPGGQDQ